MIRTVFWTVFFCVLAGILQSTLLSHIALYRAVPDLALCILVYVSYVNGAMTGQFTGFFSGILLDLISAAPLGLNSFVRTIIGALTGFIKGNFFLDLIFLPMILCAIATLLKAAIYFILHLVLAKAVPAYSLFTPMLWIELGLNCVCAPFLFGILKRFKPLSAGRGKE